VALTWESFSPDTEEFTASIQSGPRTALVESVLAVADPTPPEHTLRIAMVGLLAWGPESK